MTTGNCKLSCICLEKVNSIKYIRLNFCDKLTLDLTDEKHVLEVQTIVILLHYNNIN